MTDNKDLKNIQQYLKTQLNTPKIQEVRYVEAEDLYPDLVYEDISTYHKSYGPMGANETKWCSSCSKNVSVTSSSAKHCPDCGTAFGTVAQRSKAQEQADKNTQVASKEGGKSSYTCTTNKDGTVTETADYTKQ